jgi:hypothetical protein
MGGLLCFAVACLSKDVANVVPMIHQRVLNEYRRVRTGARAAALAFAAPALTLGLALIGLNLGGVAKAGPQNPGALSAEQRAQVGQLCQDGLGLRPGEAHYLACVESLSDSARGLDRTRLLAQARAGCPDQIIVPHSPALARCVLKAGQSQFGQTQSVEGLGEISGGGTGEPSALAPARSYFRASPREVRGREEAACAQLGLDPASPGFAGCVSSLQASLFAADNPIN